MDQIKLGRFEPLNGRDIPIIFLTVGLQTRGYHKLLDRKRDQWLLKTDKTDKVVKALRKAFDLARQKPEKVRVF